MIKNIEQFVKTKLGNETSGHDDYHCFRVRDTALLISKLEGNCNEIVVQAAALLHDVPDKKICQDVNKANTEILNLLQTNGMKEEDTKHVFDIINSLSFKGAYVDTTMKTIEGKVVQDADRLDALGAIGIARCFAYGGSVKHKIYDPEEKPELHSTEEDYRSNAHSSISHFYEKLLLLKDTMQTESGKRIAEHRHKYMENFLNEFYLEWNGQDLSIDNS